MQFLYAIEDSSKIDAEKLKSLNLSRLVGATHRGCAIGPGGSPATLISLDSENVKYKPDSQSWTKSLDGNYWIGYWSDNLPTPTELAKDVMLRGIDIELGDGNNWHIPTSRMMSGDTTLPQSIIYTGKSVAYEILPEYLDYFNAGETICDYFTAPDSDLDEITALGIIYKSVMLNYQVGIDEINILQLISSDLMSVMLCAIIGKDISAKKKALTID